MSLDAGRHPFIDAALLVVKEESEKDYVGCPYCFKRIDVAVGRMLTCYSPRCQGRQVVAELLPRRTLLAADAGRNYLLDFIPFCYRPIDINELVGDERIFVGVKKKAIQAREYGWLLVFVVLDCASPSDIRTGVETRLQLLQTQSLSNILLDLYNHQWSENLRKGLAFELIGVVARQEIAREYSGFSFEWNGMNSYLGSESDSNADFKDSFRTITETDQFKNTNGSYQPSRFESRLNADHYTLGAVESETATVEWFKRQSRSVTILGEQVTEFPLTQNGSVQPQYQHLMSGIMESILERVVLR